MHVTFYCCKHCEQKALYIVFVHVCPFRWVWGFFCRNVSLFFILFIRAGTWVMAQWMCTILNIYFIYIVIHVYLFNEIILYKGDSRNNKRPHLNSISDPWTSSLGVYQLSSSAVSGLACMVIKPVCPIAYLSHLINKWASRVLLLPSRS